MRRNCKHARSTCAPDCCTFLLQLIRILLALKKLESSPSSLRAMYVSYLVRPRKIFRVTKERREKPPELAGHVCAFVGLWRRRRRRPLQPFCPSSDGKTSLHPQSPPINAHTYKSLGDTLAHPRAYCYREKKWNYSKRSKNERQSWIRVVMLFIGVLSRIYSAMCYTGTGYA